MCRVWYDTGLCLEVTYSELETVKKLPTSGRITSIEWWCDGVLRTIERSEDRDEQSLGL